MYATEISKILVMDLMNLLKQNEKLDRFTGSLYVCHTKAMAALVGIRSQVFVLRY